MAWFLLLNANISNRKNVMINATISEVSDSTREMLQRERSTVIARMEAITRDALGVEVESDGVPASSYEREQALTVMLNSRLMDIDTALERIESGAYGICAECSTEIPAKRLQALPFATHCVACQSLADRRVKRRV
jgi:DnaK suppressor protein